MTRSFSPVRAVIFDLGGTLLDWHDWDGEVPRRWAAAHAAVAEPGWPPEAEFVEAMVAAEEAHWLRVTSEHWSGPPSGLIADGLRRLGRHADERDIVVILEAYARAVDGTAFVFDDSASVLRQLRAAGLRLGLLSNTWWAADWHNADLATHGLAGLLDELVYTSDLPHSKPHPSVFEHAAAVLGVTPAESVMVGDWPEFDIVGAQDAGLRAIWKTNGRPKPEPPGFAPDARISTLAELPAIIEGWR